MMETSSSDVRGWAVFIIIGGVIACVITPILGVAMICVGLIFVKATHIIEPVEVKAIEAAKESGGGCGWLLLAMLMIVAFGVVALAVLGAIVESGAI